MNESLSQKLNDYVKEGYLPMHMPGHKRNPSLIDPKLSTDITEISGFDNFHNPTGLIKDIANRAKTVFGSDNAYLSVNGSTGLILTSVLAASATNNSGKAIVAGNCHISVWHALELARVTPVIVMPEVHESGLFYSHISPDAISNALRKNPDVSFVILTSPTYEGIVSDTKAIYELTDKAGIPLIVDAAHGAHFGLSKYFPEEAKADIVIKSIHKTLSAPTSTAIMLTWGEKISSDMLGHYLSLTTTTSPSYVLMSGIDEAILPIENSKSTVENWGHLANIIHTEWADKFTHFTLVNPDKNNYDMSKLVFLTNGFMTGFRLSEVLHDNYKIDIEASYEGHIIAMTGIGDTEETVLRFMEAILDIDSSLDSISGTYSTSAVLDSLNPEFAMEFDEAIKSESELVSLESSDGRIATEYLFSYPPGIPVVFPGQKIKKDTIETIRNVLQNGASVVADPRRECSGEIRVKVDI